MRLPSLRTAVTVASAIFVAVPVAVLGAPSFAVAPHKGAVAETVVSGISYPSWDDVQKAKGNAEAAKTEVARITGLVNDLKAKVATTQARAVTAGNQAEAAQAAYFDADQRATQLQSQAEALKALAKEASDRAGRMAAELYRSGGNSLSAQLLFDNDTTTTGGSELLSRISSMSKLLQNSSSVYTQAQSAGNAADSASAQAASAADARLKLKATADTSFAQASTAANQAEAALHDQNTNLARLQAQLQALNDTTSKTVAAYEQGLAEKAKAEALAAQQAAEAAARAAQTARSQISSSGWVNPVYGQINDGFGPRVSPCSGCSSWHLGEDIGAAQGTIIRAAHAGTVIYAGWNGGYGNFVLVDNGTDSSSGKTVSTGYGHIMPGGILVSMGQHVSVGEAIAHVGTTGHSTGPHLHFEVRLNGIQTDPAVWMANHGAQLGQH